MSKLTSSIACPFIAIIAGCATDSTPSPEGVTSSVDQATTILDDCAIDHAANALENVDISNMPQTYVRKGDPTINTTCGCLPSPGGPNCRPTTFVNLQWEVSTWTPKYMVTVPSWSLTNGDVECNNSTLVVSLWKQTAPNTWTQQGTEQTVHPVPNSDGVCGSVTIDGAVPATSDLYRVHALATRGLPANNHGFETVKISGSLQEPPQ